nr:rod shape-determining protein MreC [Atopomonas hussainii]
MKPLFSKGPSLTTRLLVLGLLSVVLMVVDARFDTLKPVRNQMALVLTPFYWLADLPVKAWQSATEQLNARSELIAENERLKAEALLMQRRLQKLATLTEQNVRLRELLNSAELVDERVLVAELIGVDPNPFTHRLLINKGGQDGVFLGQPVLDASGLMGQVVEVMPYTARVLLITDSSHSIPVQINRNSLRSIAVGTGNPERLELRHVADTADVRVGDLLVSSGLGQRFPAGYPVATVTEVRNDPSQAFAVINAEPTAKLNRSRYLLLVFNDGLSPEQRAEKAGEEQRKADTDDASAATLAPEATVESNQASAAEQAAAPEDN